jgi:hypothetical protein
MGRSWAGFEVHRGKQRMLGAGVMFEGLSMSNDTIFVTLSPGSSGWRLWYRKAEDGHAATWSMACMR